MSASLPPHSWISSALEVVTVGLPFCVFKLLMGIVALATPPLVALGYVLLGLGAVDLVLNIVNLGSFVVLRRRVGGVCLTDILFRALGKGTSRDDLGIAFDVFISFALVAVAVGAGILPRLPGWALPVWNVAVVLNVLGAGIGRLFAALSRRRGV